MKCIFNFQTKIEKPKEDLRSIWVQGLLGSIQSQRIHPEEVKTAEQFTFDTNLSESKGIGAPKNSHWVKAL